MSNNMDFKTKIALVSVWIPSISFRLIVPRRANGYGERMPQRQQQSLVEVIQQ
jgi:hypothetical protein